MGRINRKVFLMGIILKDFIYFAGFSLLVAWKDPMVDTIYFPVFYFVWFLLYMLLVIRRLHDTNRSGMWTVLILIPRLIAHLPFLYFPLIIPRMIIDNGMILYLLFKKGTDGTNEYGEKPGKFF